MNVLGNFFGDHQMGEINDVGNLDEDLFPSGGRRVRNKKVGGYSMFSSCKICMEAFI